MKYYLRVGDKVAEEEKCIHCGLCQKICPTGNIAMADNRIAFGENCTNCFGCINWCPAKAIRFGRINVEKARQYRCPGIRAEELMNGGGWQSRQELDG